MYPESVQPREWARDDFYLSSVALPLAQAVRAVRDYHLMQGVRFDIIAGRRTYDEQAERYAADPEHAAKPGTSNHETGQAVDISSPAAKAGKEWADVLASFGLKYLDSKSKVEPWHLELIRHGTSS